MFLKSKTLMIVLSSFMIADCIKIECIFFTNERPILGTTYMCSATIIQVGDLRNVTEVTGNHLDGQSNKDVTGFDMYNQVDYVPHNLNHFFPNLLVLSIWETPGFSDVQENDLKQFPKLKWFQLNDNNIESINKNLFKHNPLLEFVSLKGNQIKHVANNAFDNLSQLSTLYIGGPCIKREVSTDKAGVKQLISDLIRQCPQTLDMAK